MPQGSGPNAVMNRFGPGRALGTEPDTIKTRAEVTTATREGAMGAFVTSRSAFEDLTPFSKDGQRAGLVEKSIGTGASGGGVSAWLLSLGGDREVTRPFLQNPWVYACVTANGKAIGSLPVQILKGKGKDAVEQGQSNPLVKLFEVPNPLQSQAKFFKLLTYYHLLWGETYLILLSEQDFLESDGASVKKMLPVKVKTGEGMLATVETPEEIWPVAGHLVEEVFDSNKGPLPVAYKVHTGSGVEQYPAHAVVQLADANPHSVLRGVGPTTAVLRDIAKAYQIDRYDDALLENGGVPGGTLSIEGRLADHELRAVREAWRESHERVDSHRKTAILPHGTKYTPHGFSPNEMEFKELREWIRQTIMAVYGVTKPILGITDDVNRANSAEAYRVFWETTIIPLVRYFEDEINFKLIRRIEEFKGQDLHFSLNLDDVAALREDIDAKVERTLKLYKDGHRTFTEAAMLAGWDLGEQKLEGNDERWIQTNLLPVDLALEGPPEPPAPEDTEEGEDDTEDEDDADDEGKSVRSPEEDSRDAELTHYWRTHDSYLRGRETTLQRAIFGEFRSFLRFYSKRLTDIAKGARSTTGAEVRYVVTEAELERLLDINFDLWNEQMFGVVEPHLVGTMVSSAQRLQFEVGGTASLLSGTDPDVLDFLRGKKLQIVEGYQSNLAKNLQRRMVAVLAEAPANLSTLAQAIAEVLEELQAEVEAMQSFAGKRAMMIARTEVTSASSFARTAQMRADDIDEHTWLTSRDNQVRASHLDLEGVTAAVGQSFGHNLRFPGDPNGAAADIIQCRCTTIPELPERQVPPIWEFDFTTETNL